MVQQNEQQAGGEDGVYLHLNVQDQAGAVVSFRVLTRTKLEKLMNVYCTRMGLNLNAVRFRFKGNQLRPEDTVRDVPNLRDRDIIEVFT